MGGVTEQFAVVRPGRRGSEKTAPTPSGTTTCAVVTTFIGDLYTHGTGGSSIASRTRLRLRLLPVSYPEMVSDALATHAQIFVVTWAELLHRV